jgi:hypothetical protein
MKDIRNVFGQRVRELRLRSGMSQEMLAFRAELTRSYTETRVLAFQVNGLLTPKDVDYMASTLLGILTGYGKGEVSILVDHRDMLAADGEPVVYSPEVAERAVTFQQNLLKTSKKVAVLCNSEFMVQNLRHVTAISGMYEQSNPLFGKDKDMVQEAYDLLGVNGNELIKMKKE